MVQTIFACGFIVLYVTLALVAIWLAVRNADPFKRNPQLRVIAGVLEWSVPKDMHVTLRTCKCENPRLFVTVKDQKDVLIREVPITAEAEEVHATLETMAHSIMARRERKGLVELHRAGSAHGVN